MAAPGSAERGLAELVAWLWRLGPVGEEPAADAVAFGAADRAEELRALVRERRLAGAVILGEGAREERVLSVPAAPWGDLAFVPVLTALASFLPGVLGRPLVALPPVGCLRLDDAPGTAELQLLDRAKPDAKERRRIDAMVRALDASKSVLVAAVAARAFDGRGEVVPIEQVWPESFALIADAVERGLMEPACHGLLHLDPHEHAQGRVAPKEFLRLSREEAGARLDEALAWMRERLGPARSFIAPAWGYSEGSLEAAAERDLATWTWPEPGPLLDGHLLRETLLDGLPGLTGLDYAPLERMAVTGVPPTVVFHGRLLADRLPRLREARDVLSLARLVRRRDLERIAALRGVRWVGAQQLVERLRAHEAIEVEGDRVDVPDGVEAVLIDARPGPPRRAPAGAAPSARR
ncbi:MAG: hypothetical protein M3320_10530 [Actinomycetota bacterium]|nr:hypothetical protein [Actinomycetota bacterium]